MKILVTGSAGFIGSSLVCKLLERGELIIGIDNHNSYYDTSLKEARIARFIDEKNYTHHKKDICNYNFLDDLFRAEKPDVVVNLAAQAGVRYSLKDPFSYINSNIVGFANILECSRKYEINNLVYASTSSVYGANSKVPYSETDNTNHPLSLYAASKKSNELMAHTYSHLYNLSTTGLRFFTVYGPWGRPDMSPIKFVKAILSESPIDVFNYGKHLRDFTYIDDVTNGIIKVIYKKALPNMLWESNKPDPSSSSAPWKIYNIGNNNPIELLDYIGELEKSLNKKARLNFLPLQPGDVLNTCADIDKIYRDLDYNSSTNITDGIKKFVSWYLEYYEGK